MLRNSSVRRIFMKINCLSCGHKVDLDDVYDDFEGLIKCFACNALLEIRTEQGQLKYINFVDTTSTPGAGEVQKIKGLEVFRFRGLPAFGGAAGDQASKANPEP
jgi:ribosomal protein S27E